MQLCTTDRVRARSLCHVAKLEGAGSIRGRIKFDEREIQRTAVYLHLNAR